MPRLFSSQRLTAVIAATLATGAVAIVPASAETRIETVLGTVTKSDPIRTSYIRKTPSDEKVCETQEVPVYGEASAGSNNNNSDLGAMIIGGVIGSAIGNKTSDQDGAGAAGAVVGALLGREHANKKNQQGGQQIVGYRQQEVCQTNRIVQEEVIEKIVGYRIKVEADGRILSLNASRPLTVGDRVEVNKKVSYALN